VIWKKTGKPEPEAKGRAKPGLLLRKLLKWVLVFCIVLSLVAIVFYVKDTDSTDETLFFLLWVLRCVSIFICVLSVLSMIFNICLVFRNPSFVLVLGIVLYLLAALWGAALIAFNSFIVVIAGGNS